MWRVKDFFINTFLTIRLLFYVFFKPSRFKNVNNSIEKKGWKLTFNDEFDQSEIDKKKWRTDTYYGLRYHPGNITEKGVAPDVYYEKDLFEFEDSVMKQKMTDESKKIKHVDWNGKDWGEFTIPYRASQIDSSNSFEQKYGYFEIRSKTTPEPGAWPAFWLASAHAWPPEIDIYEIYTGKKKGMLHFESNFHWMPSNKKKMKVKKHRVSNVSEEFHLYAVDWNEKRFKIYYDNMLIRIFSNPEAIKFFEYPMHIIVGTGPDLKENRANKINKANFPTYHEVDYVRAYTKKL